MSFLKKMFKPQGLPPKPAGHFTHKGLLAKKKDYSVSSWSEYFDSEHSVTADGTSTTYHFYRKGVSGPLIIFLHGGGFSGLSWALLSKYLIKFVHCQCVAFDQRGHGSTTTADDYKLSADQLASDVSEFVNELLKKEDSDKQPGVILVGHSMGGAVAIHAASRDKIANLLGLVVIDVVEGSALESLHVMQGVLKNRPKTFESAEKAIEWSVRTGYIRNLESARASMIGQLKRLEVPVEVSNRHYSDSSSNASSPSNTMDVIVEDDDVDTKASTATGSSTCGVQLSSVRNKQDIKLHHFGWRIDLSQTAEHWKGWFKGMSATFLSVAVPKLLMLAGIDRLDTQLTAAQMQGKFQMQVLSKSGHAVHEDVPEKVAEAIAAFLVRHQFAEAASDFKRPFPAC